MPSDPNFLLNYFEEMPSDGESDVDFDDYITKMRKTKNPAALQSPAPPSPLAKSELLALAFVQLVLVRYFLALISLHVTMLCYTYINFFDK